jgi:membrane-bound ClpP family serine protease
MSLPIILTLITIGLLLLLIEILILPGIAIIGLSGIGLIIIAIYNAYNILGIEVGHTILASTVIGSILIIYFALKTNTWKKLMLKTELKGKVPNLAENLIKVGDNGTSSSRLAPIGKAFINDQFVEVESVDGFVDENKNITVVRIEGNKLYIKSQKS